MSGKNNWYPESVSPGLPKLSRLNPAWRTWLIGDLFKSQIRPIKLEDNKKYNLITVKRSRGGVKKRSILSGSRVAVKSQFLLETGDFLISKRQIVHGACGFVPASLSGSIVSNEYEVLKCTDILHPDFLAQLIHTTYFQQTCFHSSIGVHIEKMIFKTPTWFKWKIKIPPIPEQKKIADFLATVDKRIELLENKKSKLDEYKKGLLQKLFPKKDAALPELRFKRDDGGEFGGWEIFKFNKIARKHTKQRAPKLSNVESILELDSIEPNSGKVLKVYSSTEVKSMKLEFTSESILFAKMRPSLRKYAFPRFSGLCSSEFWVLQANNSIVTMLYYLIQSDDFMKVATQTSGSKIPRADWNKVASHEFKIPSILEQQKIADFLTTVDEKIEQTNSRIDKMNYWKKGLLQKMFV